MLFEPSIYQLNIFEWITHGSGHAVVNAVAGSGKSTTLVEAAKRLPPAQSAVFIAFNNHVVAELGTRLQGTTMKAKTLHSIGMQSLYRRLPKVQNPDTRKYYKIARTLVERAYPYDTREQQHQNAQHLAKLVGLARLTLTDPRSESGLLSIAHRYLEDFARPLVKLVGMILETGMMQADKVGLIDFTDMIYLPVRWSLPLPQYDWVFADEIQDFNACQVEIALKTLKPGGRFLGVGDPRQSIMAFAGADDLSFEKVKERLLAEELPLDICYRCPTTHIELAQKIVPQIRARKDAPEGKVISVKTDEALELVKDGDLVICRSTAPVVAQCIQLIERGVKARVRGRDVAQLLVDLVKAVEAMPKFKFKAFSKFLDKFATFQLQALRDEEGSEGKIESFTDRVAAVRACYAKYGPQCKSVNELNQYIEDLFSDEKSGVWLSTIHRAKGLESNRVVILQYNRLPLYWKEQHEFEAVQEENLLYVALTRARQELVLVSHEKDKTTQQHTLDNRRSL